MTGEDRVLFVNASVQTEDPSDVPRIVDALARAATGLALEGLDATISIGSFDPDEEGPDA